MLCSSASIYWGLALESESSKAICSAMTTASLPIAAITCDRLSASSDRWSLFSEQSTAAKTLSGNPAANTLARTAVFFLHSFVTLSIADRSNRFIFLISEASFSSTAKSRSADASVVPVSMSTTLPSSVFFLSRSTAMGTHDEDETFFTSAAQ